jgi:hypothetical protein
MPITTSASTNMLMNTGRRILASVKPISLLS